MSSPRRILVIDDSRESQRLLEAVLSSQGYEVTVASTGPEGLVAVAEQRPDLVLLDLFMPEMDGHVVCSTLRADPPTAALPVVMLTSAGDDERIRALETGADDYVTKPFVRAELLARVKSLLRIKGYHDTIEAQAEELKAWNSELEARVAEQVGELERLGRLQRILPSHVADLVAAAGDQDLFETHRAEIAVLACALRGFASFARTAEPEEVVAVVREFHAVVEERVAAFEATVGQLCGDRLTVFFNDPVACDDPAGRAAAMAVDLRCAVESLGGTTRRDGYEPGLAAGVALGYATLGIMGFEGCAGYGAVGHVVNLASRLCDRAGTGQILVNQAVQAGAAHLTDVHHAGVVELPGYPEPVDVWAVGGVERVEVGPQILEPGAPAAASPTSVTDANLFRRLDEGWIVVYEGQEHRFRDSKGLRYLARLIAESGREFHVADLAMGGSAQTLRPVLTGAGDVLDHQAKATYQRRLADLRAERDEASEWGNAERAAKADAEIEWIAEELSAAYGLGGRSRQDGDVAERVRKAVTNRIHHGITTIQRVHPILGRHLTNSVRTGTFCSYQPERPVEWRS